MTHERGAASLEYAGMLAVVVMVVGAVVVGVTPVGEVIKGKICEALEAGCSSQHMQERVQAMTECVTRQDQRHLAFGGNVRFFNAERRDGDQVSVKADGDAEFLTSQSSALGVGITGKKVGRGGAGVDAKAQLAGDATYIYNVPADWGGEEAAYGMRGDRNGTLDRYGRLVVGPMATSIEEGVTRGKHIVEDGISLFNEHVLGNEPSAEEVAAREQEQSLNEADAIRVSLGLQGSAGVSMESRLLEGDASGLASVKGEATVPLNTDGPDAATAKFAAIVDLEGQLGATLGMPGDGRAGQQGTADLPPFLRAAVGGGKKWSYQVEYSDDGEPTRLVMEIETRGGGSLGLDVGGRRGDTEIATGADVSTGNAEVTHTILDLTVPENRAAFDQTFYTFGVGVGDHQARVSQMKLLPFDDMSTALAALQDRINRDAVVVDFEYDLSGTGVGAGNTRQQDGIDFAVAGVSWEDSSQSRRLVQAVAHDNRYGGVEVPLMSGCGG